MALQTDNEPQYSSKKFKNFTMKWTFDQETSTTTFPRSNGLAEIYVKKAKALLLKCINDRSDIYLVLLSQRNTLGSPNQRLMGKI